MRSLLCTNAAFFALFLAACGGPSARTATTNAAGVESPTARVESTPFQVTLPDGSTVALEHRGAISIDGDVVGTLQGDGRVESLDGETFAALLPDGRISFAGQLTADAIVGARLVENGVALLELQQDRSLTIRAPSGDAVATVPVVGVTPRSRTTVLYVIALRYMLLAFDRADAEATAAPAAQEIVRVRVPIDGRPSRGPADAPVTIVMIEDLECPFCARAAVTMRELREQYGESLRFVWVHNPLPFHERADEAASFVEEARAQRGDAGFWAATDLLMENHHALEDANLARFATQLELDARRVRAAIADGRHRTRIEADQTFARALGATGTPAFFVNGIPLRGAQPLEVFRAAVDAELATVAEMTRAGVPAAQVYERLIANGVAQIPPRPPSEGGGGATRGGAGTQVAGTIYRVPVTAEQPSRGPSDALVTMVVFSDFECPFCGRVLPTLAQLEERYGADLRIVFRHNPLPFHQHALPAAEAASEAFAQGGSDAFWRMHDVLFANREHLEERDLEGYARQLGLDVVRFRRALARHVHRASIQADQTLATTLGASGTPGFFINGRLFLGAQPVENFASLIDDELARAREMVRTGTPRARVYEARTGNGATTAMTRPGEPSEEEDADRVYTLPVPTDAPAQGGANARVTVQVFSDFQCPFCSRFASTLRELEERYGDRVRWVFRHYPLPFHANAPLAHEAAVEIREQLGDDAFWRFHDALFANQRWLDREALVRYATALGGVDVARFEQALTDRRHRARVQADIDAIAAAGARIGTPSCFVEGRLLQGAQPAAAFEAVIDRALREAPAAPRGRGRRGR